MGGKKFDANETKTQLKLAISRIKLQKNKKDNNIKNNKREIAELLRNGKDESARIKVENIIREDFVIEAYEILELFCELLLARLGVIQISKDCPPDIREAVCTIIYAAPRTDIKELGQIREQLIHKFGKEFGMASMSNKENCVNPRVVHKLSIQTPENYIVFQYLNEIAKSFGLEWKHDLVPEPIGATPGQPQPMNVTPALFPEPPKGNVNTLSFPDTPQHISSPANFSPIPPPSSAPNFPSFPEPPKFDVNSIPIPNFNFNGLPGVTQNDVPPPNYVQPPQQNNSNGLPDFPVVPNANNGGYNSAPSFPSFPTVPSGTGTMRSDNNVAPSLDFPSPPGADNTESKDGSVPDFDELTARFEKLKKRDQ